MLGGDFERFLDSFADRDAGDNDDKLTPAIAAVHLEHRFDVAIGLPGAGLHLDIEVHFGALGGDELGRLGEILLALDSLDIGEDGLVRECDGGVPISLFTKVHFRNILLSGIEPVADSSGLGLANEAIGDGIDGSCLVGLVGELELHDE